MCYSSLGAAHRVPFLVSLVAAVVLIAACGEEPTSSSPPTSSPSPVPALASAGPRDAVNLGRGLTADVVGTSTLSLVDALGAATPATQFSVFGSAGTAIASSQFVGPEFILTQPTTITEIGGFVNSCAQCPGTLAFTVQIRPSSNGIPDAATVLASFTLSHDDDPLVISYESVAPNLTLGPGSYFALFAPQGSDAGFLLGHIDPFIYQAGSITLGILNPSTGISSAQADMGAVRVLGAPVTTPQAAIQLLMIDVGTLVSEGELTKGRGNSLVNKLRATVASLDRGRTKTGCNQLRAFVNQVHALVRAGRLPIEAGQQLNDAVEGVRTQIECL